MRRNSSPPPVGEVDARSSRARAGIAQEVLDELRVVVVGGISLGVVVAGIGSRLAMFLLRLTSPEYVIGVTSDDGFTIGEFTLGGTYNLLALGAAVGILGAAVYRMVAPRLIGPRWFRRLTTGLAAAAVVGAMLVHADGIDFRVLGPTWFAIGLFVGLPGLFGLLIGPVVDSVASPGSWTAYGRRRWVLPVLLVAGFPPTLLLLGISAFVLAAWVALRSLAVVRRVRRAPLFVLAVRAGWLSVAGLGLIALANDISALT